MMKAKENGAGDANAAAVEVLVSRLEDRMVLMPEDVVLVSHLRSLAEAVDSRPQDSQLAMVYRKAFDDVRDLARRDDGVPPVVWKIKTGCDEKTHRPFPHCAVCCRQGTLDPSIDDERLGSLGKTRR